MESVHGNACPSPWSRMFCSTAAATSTTRAPGTARRLPSRSAAAATWPAFSQFPSVSGSCTTGAEGCILGLLARLARGGRRLAGRPLRVLLVHGVLQQVADGEAGRAARLRLVDAGDDGGRALDGLVERDAELLLQAPRDVVAGP